MPDLLNEMRRDLSDASLCREFIVMRKGMVFWYPPYRQIFTYFLDDHDALDGKLRILENLGFIRDIRSNSVPRFAFDEKLVDYLTR